MTSKNYILTLKIFIITNLAFVLYHTIGKFYVLYTPSVTSITPINTVENTHALLNYPVLFNLVAISVIFLFTQTIDNNVDYNNLFLIRYGILGLKTTPKILLMLLFNLFRKFAFTIKLNFLTQSKFVSFIYGHITSFFLLWRPLFKRISYYGKLLKNRNFWKIL